jgi:hypothetical protein
MFTARYERMFHVQLRFTSCFTGKNSSSKWCIYIYIYIYIYETMGSAIRNVSALITPVHQIRGFRTKIRKTFRQT